MRRIFLKILCALGPALLADSGTQAQNLIVNGDFEAPILADGTYQMLSEIPGWRVVSGPGLDLCRLGWEVDGKQMVELDSSANSGIRQVVPTIPGKRYELSVFYAPRWGSQFPPQTSVVHVFFNGRLLQSISGSSSTISYRRYKWTVTASSIQSAVVFRAGGTSDSYGGWIDHVMFIPLD